MRILALLCHRDETVGGIAERLGVKPNAVSQALSILRRDRLVAVTRGERVASELWFPVGEGFSLWYWLEAGDEHLVGLPITTTATGTPGFREVSHAEAFNVPDRERRFRSVGDRPRHAAAGAGGRVDRAPRSCCPRIGYRVGGPRRSLRILTSVLWRFEALRVDRREGRPSDVSSE